MLRSLPKSPSRRAANAFDVAESWPDDTIVVLPETPRVRPSPRRKIMPHTPGWPPATDMETIRMYHDSEPEDEGHTLNFAMNQDFIESTSRLSVGELTADMHSFIPTVSPGKVSMRSPAKKGRDQDPLEDDCIEIPESAGLSERTRDAIFNVWAHEDNDDSGFDEGVHYTKDCQATQYKKRNAKLNKTIRYLVSQLQEKEKEIQRIPLLEKKLITFQTAIKSLALIPKTPMRTSSLKHTIDATANTSKDLAPPKTPSRHASKENVPSSPRKALAEIASNIPDSTEAVDSGKRALAALYQQNTALQNKLQAVESENTALIERHNAKISSLETELHSLVAENHRLEKELQISRAETALASMSPRHGGDDSVVRRLSEELAWHAKLHLYAERERMRLLDLLEFAGLEGRVVGREVGVLRERLSVLSLRSCESGKCLV